MDISYLQENISVLWESPELLLAEAAKNVGSFVFSPGGVLFLILRILVILFSIVLFAALIYFVLNAS